MKPIKPCTLPGIRAAREALERGEPMTLAEIQEYNRQRAEEMARAEAARMPTPQLEFVSRDESLAVQQFGGGQ